MPEAYALSAKTESEKFRIEISAKQADAIYANPDRLDAFLPGNLVARLNELAGDNQIMKEVVVSCQRYTIEDDQDRFTLDVDIKTDTGKAMPYGVLEYKSANDDNLVWTALDNIGLYPLKLSKFLWATCS